MPLRHRALAAAAFAVVAALPAPAATILLTNREIVLAGEITEAARR